MRTWLLIAVLAACSKKADPPAAAPAAEPAPAPAPTPTQGAAAPAPTPAPAPAPAPSDDLAKHASAFMMKFADALDAAAGAKPDCAKLGAGLEAIAPDAKALRAELVAAKKKLDDVKPDASVMARLQAIKDPSVLDKCKKDASVKKGVDDTLLTIAPLEEDTEFVKAFGDAFGKAMAPK